MSYLVPPKGNPPVEIATYYKSGEGDLTNLPYLIPMGQEALMEVGSSNWTEISPSDSHPSIELTSDFGIKFNKTGIYRVDCGFNINGNGTVSGTRGMTALFKLSDTAPDPTASYYMPAAAFANIAYNRFDLALASGQNISLDPDYNATINVTTAGTTVYFYGYVTGGNSSLTSWFVRGNQYKLSTLSITREGNSV